MLWHFKKLCSNAARKQQTRKVSNSCYYWIGSHRQKFYTFNSLESSVGRNIQQLAINTRI